MGRPEAERPSISHSYLRLSFTTDLAAGVKGAEAIFIAVGTPSRRADGHADLSYVYGVAHEIGAALDGPAVVVTKSTTVWVGTGDEVERTPSEVAPTRWCRSAPIPNSSANERRSRTSNVPTVASSDSRMRVPKR